jgi:WD40 repeat protein
LEEVAILKGHWDGVISVAFSPDSKFLASGVQDKTVKVWEVGSWQEVTTLKGMGILCIQFPLVPMGSFWLRECDKTVKVWEVGSWREVTTLKGA